MDYVTYKKQKNHKWIYVQYIHRGGIEINQSCVMHVHTSLKLCSNQISTTPLHNDMYKHILWFV